MEYPLTKLVPFTEHKDAIRRGGVISTIKYASRSGFTGSKAILIISVIRRNCSFDKQSHQALLSPETELVFVPPSEVKAPGVDALTYILLPLAGPEEFDLEVRRRRVSGRLLVGLNLARCTRLGPGTTSSATSAPSPYQKARGRPHPTLDARRDPSAALYDAVGERVSSQPWRV